MKAGMEAVIEARARAGLKLEMRAGTEVLIGFVMGAEMKGIMDARTRTEMEPG